MTGRAWPPGAGWRCKCVKWSPRRVPIFIVIVVPGAVAFAAAESDALEPFHVPGPRDAWQQGPEGEAMVGR